MLATDLNEATLDVARTRRRWPDHAGFQIADAFEVEAIGGDHDALLAAFLWSHIPLGRLDTLLGGIRERLRAGAVIAFADNNYVEGSNHPIVRTDEAGNTYQRRQLEDGSAWEVLKNFPSPDELQGRLWAMARTYESSRSTTSGSQPCDAERRPRLQDGRRVPASPHIE